MDAIAITSNATAPNTPPPITERTPSAVCSPTNSAAAIPMPCTNAYASSRPEAVNANTFARETSAGR